MIKSYSWKSIPLTCLIVGSGLSLGGSYLSAANYIPCPKIKEIQPFGDGYVANPRYGNHNQYHAHFFGGNSHNPRPQHFSSAEVINHMLRCHYEVPGHLPLTLEDLAPEIDCRVDRHTGEHFICP